MLPFLNETDRAGLVLVYYSGNDMKNKDRAIELLETTEKNCGLMPYEADRPALTDDEIYDLAVKYQYKFMVLRRIFPMTNKEK